MFSVTKSTIACKKRRNQTSDFYMYLQNKSFQINIMADKSISIANQTMISVQCFGNFHTQQA